MLTLLDYFQRPGRKQAVDAVSTHTWSSARAPTHASMLSTEGYASRSFVTTSGFLEMVLKSLHSAYKVPAAQPG